ncbi:MAG: VIT domain-containing protein [Pirellulaceae bacterium]
MTSYDQDRDEEERFAALFSSINHDELPPDSEFLERLRARSTEVFVDADQSRTVGTAGSPQRRSKMIVLMMRGLAASAAALVLFASWYFVRLDEQNHDKLEIAFVNLSNAQSLHLTLVQHGQPTDVWFGQPHRLRKNLSDGAYQIDDGQQLWEINEGENQAIPRASVYFRADQPGFDVLRLVDITQPQEQAELLAARPRERVAANGTLCDVYRWISPSSERPLQVEALVRASDKMLHSLRTHAIHEGRTQLVSELSVTAVNLPIDENLFKISDTLTLDGRIGKETECQGLVSVKPSTYSRWTPVQQNLLLKPRDWVRTDVRGANAAALRLVGTARLTLGPGTLVELESPQRIKVMSGELKVVTDADDPVTLLGPDNVPALVRGTGLYGVADDKLARLKATPAWIAGFEGTSTQEAIGSLIAKIDGRDVPLTVGYHKVAVDIRDQIARTVIDESFVNHTPTQLEGVFYFPLPEDASISGFGMWIGDEYVEADIVEKQRAREIYETILREKRDPGLLEWTGGNVFKARVFPIPGNSEKRVRISYTQVLPLHGNRYRYSYALQSELLRQYPLRELGIDVKINSAVPLSAVTCPTHAIRIDTTPHAARAEFAAQEYTPSRDFELVVELDGSHSDVVMIPHRRGDDGYFMLQVTPPSAVEIPVRDVVPDGTPLRLLVLADTSRSMDRDSRTAQSEFIVALLSSLSPKDSFNLATCDTECTWAFDKPVPAEESNVQNVRRVLDDRSSLGWTDLDRACVSAFQQAGAGAHVIYVGDGIVTTGNADAVEFSNRLRTLDPGQQCQGHAVAVNSRFETTVMKSLAAVGGGTFRRITGQTRPAVAARELLAEIAQPATRILNVDFPGLMTARVYPEGHSRLPAGGQQILLGRYLPSGERTEGEVVVTAQRGDETFEMRTQVSLQEAEDGNSFIPRLWARMHLDALLQQGSSVAIQDEIIALSEEYHIMTPYTSLLVLETDADRERFRVKRRFQMRDGERFFATGRDQVNYDLTQKQMRQAGDWRTRLRTAALRELSTLGRDMELLQSRRPESIWFDSSGRTSINRDVYWGLQGTFKGVSSVAFSPNHRGLAPHPTGGSRPLSGSDGVFGERLSEVDSLFFSVGDRTLGFEGKYLAGTDGDYDFDDNIEFAGETTHSKLTLSAAAWDKQPYPESELLVDDAERYGDYDVGRVNRVKLHDRRDQLTGRSSLAGAGAYPYAIGKRLYETALSSKPLTLFTGSSLAPGHGSPAPSWLGTLFPHLPPASTDPQRPEVPSMWPNEARAIAEGLLRTNHLAAHREGLEITRDIDHFQPRTGRVTSHQSTSALISPAQWLVRRTADTAQTIVEVCDASQRSTYGMSFQLGRSRAATPHDLQHPPLDLSGYVLTSLERDYPVYVPSVERQSDTVVELTLTHPTIQEDSVLRFVIDTEKYVLLSMEVRVNDEITTSQKYGEFVEWGGAWWPTQIETLDTQGRRTQLVAQRFQPLGADEFAARLKELQTGREAVQFLHEPLAEIPAAKHSIDDGRGTFEDQMVMLGHFYGVQQWDRVLQHLERLEALAVDKPGMRWIRDAVMSDSRQREELRQRYMQRATELAQLPAGEAGSDRYFLAQYLLSQAGGILESNEVLALLDTLKPVFETPPPHIEGGKQWRQYQIDYLHRAGQAERVLELKQQQAVDYPHDASLQEQYAEALVQSKDYAAAKAFLDGVLGSEIQWNAEEEESLRNVITQMYRQQDRYAELVSYLAAWVATNPKGASAYQQYLSALIKNDQIEEAIRLTDLWLEEGLQLGRSTKPVAARLAAAVGLALGQGFELQTDRLDPRWWEPLAMVVQFFVQQDTLPYCTHQIMLHARFQETEHCQRVRREILQLLSDEVFTLPISHLQHFVDWTWSNEVQKTVWAGISTSLRQRWEAEVHPERRHVLGQVLARILQGKIGTEEYLGFLRVQLEQGPQQYQASYAHTFFDALIRGPWSPEREEEAFGLLTRLSDVEDVFERLAAQVSALQLLTDSAVQSRFQVLMDQVPSQSDLTRTQLRDKQTGNLRLARVAYAERLKQRMRDASELMTPWLTAEWTYLQMILEENLDEFEQRSWEVLGAAPLRVDTGSALGDALEESLLRRFLLTLMNLAARRDAKPELIERLLAYVDRGIELHDETSAGWKRHKYLLLIARDRFDELVSQLRAWIQANDALRGLWELSLGYLLAEQGKVPEAIEYFEKLRTGDLLTGADLQVLADWYMVVNERDKYEQVRVASFEKTEEGQLRDALTAPLERWERPTTQGRVHREGGGPMPGTIPGELDEDVLLIFKVLFAKSSEPGNYVHLLRRYYRATRDFRLLTGLGDAVLGQTAGKIYPWLQQAGTVLSEVREEATVDSLVAHLPQVRERAKSEVDQRSLDLLEFMLERRAAELLNQPDPHAERALAAMQRAFKREWSHGEPRLMAGLLSGLGAISHTGMAQEQVRQMEILHDQAEAGTSDRLDIALKLANLYWSYNRQTQATDLLQASLAEHQRARAGILPIQAQHALETYVGYLRQRGLHAEAERTLLEQLKRPANSRQTIWLAEELSEVYEDALANDSIVSLGAGVVLYKALVDRLLTELRHDDKNHRQACIQRLVSVYGTAHNKQIETASQDLVAFGREQLPSVLRQQINGYQTIVGSVAENIKVLAGPREGLAFLIQMLNDEPRWFSYLRQDGWNEHAWRLNQWRLEVEELGDLESPLLAIVIRELRCELETRQERNRYLYWQYHNGYFWEAQRDVFLRTAETVYAEYKGSPPTRTYVAQYVAVGLENYRRGIEMLRASLQEGTLDKDGQHKLVTWLHHENRYSESIPLLQEMMQRWPEDLGYGTMLMRAYHKTQHGAALLALLKQTVVHLKESKRWDEGAIAQLSEACLDCALFEHSVQYYTELISLHKRTQPDRGIGGGTLSSYCSGLARAYAGAGRTAEAVDAACEAIISWGPQQRQRQEAFKSLTGVLRAAKDLEQYVQTLDRESAETGSDKPVVRKALGLVYAEKQEWARAIVQLKFAIQLQPYDTETNAKLLECYDALGDKPAAIEQLLAALESSPLDLELCRQLGRRFQDASRTADAERAYTSIVELRPQEAESHAMLAEVREEQDRWSEAARHWEQVAKIRALEPTGLVKLANAQIHLQQWDAVKQTIQKLKSHAWPARFETLDAEIRVLEARVPAGK